MVRRQEKISVVTAVACSNLVLVNAFLSLGTSSVPCWRDRSCSLRQQSARCVQRGQYVHQELPHLLLRSGTTSNRLATSSYRWSSSLSGGSGTTPEENSLQSSGDGDDSDGDTDSDDDSQSAAAADGSFMGGGLQAEEEASDISGVGSRDEAGVSGGEGVAAAEILTDEDMSTLYSRISAMRELDVEIDRVCAYNWRRGTCSHDLLFQAADPIQHLAWADDQLAFSTCGGGTWIIDRSTGFVVNVFEGHLGDVTALCFDGEFLVTGGSDKTVRVQRNSRDALFNDALGECVHVLEGHTERVTGVARIDSTRLASCSVDGSLRVWDLVTGKVLNEMLLPSPGYCLGAADGYLVTGLMDGRVIAWQAKDPATPPTEILALDAHKGAVTALSFPKQDVLLTGGGDGRVKYWDLRNGGAAVGNRYEVDGQAITHTFRGHSGPVCAVQGNDHRIVSAGMDGTVSAWDLGTGEELFQMYGHYGDIRSLQFDREYLVTDGTGDRIYVHDFTGRRGSPP